MGFEFIGSGSLLYFASVIRIDNVYTTETDNIRYQQSADESYDVFYAGIYRLDQLYFPGRSRYLLGCQQYYADFAAVVDVQRNG